MMKFSNIAAGAPRVSESGFCTWLSRAEAGDVITYHQGFLACDTNYAVSALPTAERVELGHVARSARWAADEGLVHLVQQRLAPDQFAYLAVARPRTPTRSQRNPNRSSKEKA